MAQVRQGDLRKLAVLFERHHKSLYNYFLHLNSDRDRSQDLVQDVFFRILRYRHTYDPARPFLAWMYQIARNAGAESAGKNRAGLRLVEHGVSQDDEPGAFEPVSPTPGAEETLARRQQVGLLRRALARLPHEKREVLLLSRFQNLKYQDIGQILGCEAGAVKLRVYRAMRALEEIYFELSGERVS